MKTSRRTFLKTGAVALAGSTALSRSLFARPRPVDRVGIQLYSVREDMKKDPLATLKLVSGTGYKFVEHADYHNRKFYGHPAAEFKKILADLGMTMPSGHTVLNKQHWDDSKNDFTDIWKQTVEDAAIAGQQYVVSPWLDESWRKTHDTLKKYMDVFNKSGELCKKSGMKFGYHNHDFEFSQKLDGVAVYDLILKYTDPKLVIQQLDIGNLFNGGATALDIVTRYPGRFESMHVKDEIKAAEGAEKYESTILGTGIVHTREVVDLGRKSGGTTLFIIEQESYQGQQPIDAAKKDLDVMISWGY